MKILSRSFMSKILEAENVRNSLFLLGILLAVTWSSSILIGLNLINQAEAIFLPKARICFNSMTSFFQSECVYCDSRLYASTITSCTGQPTLAANVTQAQAFCIATACLQQTGKSPIVLGKRRRRRSLIIPWSLNKNKQSLKPNGTVTAQLNKSVNGTTVGNLAFVLNNPSAAYIWSNPLTRVLTRNNPNKSIQWQFGRPAAAAAGGAAPATAAAAAGSAPATGAAAAAPKPAAAGVSSGSGSIVPATSTINTNTNLTPGSSSVIGAGGSGPAVILSSGGVGGLTSNQLQSLAPATGSYVTLADGRRFPSG